MKFFNSFWERFLEYRILSTFIIFILAAIVIAILTYFHHAFDIDSLLVESIGMLLDILIIGIFVAALDDARVKKLEIRRYHEEIDDFRAWESEEAKFRIIGNIKRLNRKKISAIKLDYCFLPNSSLRNCNLSGAVLNNANLMGADLRYSNLSKANIHNAKLQGADLRSSNLNEANLIETNLSESELDFCSMVGENLEFSFLEKADLSNTNVLNAKFDSASLQEADLMNCKNLTVEQLEKVFTLYNAKLNPEIEKRLRDTHPHLFEDPSREKIHQFKAV